MRASESDVIRTFIHEPDGSGHWMLTLGTCTQYCGTGDIEYRESLNEIVNEYNSQFS